MGYWKHGQRSKLAKAAHVNKHNLYAILYRKRGVGKYLARDLMEASIKVLGFPIPFEAWLFNSETTHPAFYGDPKHDSN